MKKKQENTCLLIGFKKKKSIPIIIIINDLKPYIFS